MSITFILNEGLDWVDVGFDEIKQVTNSVVENHKDFKTLQHYLDFNQPSDSIENSIIINATFVVRMAPLFYEFNLGFNFIENIQFINSYWNFELTIDWESFNNEIDFREIKSVRLG